MDADELEARAVVLDRMAARLRAEAAERIGHAEHFEQLAAWLREEAREHNPGPAPFDKRCSN
jgi:hypothetical protein